MTASPDWESLLWEARGYLALDDDEAVPREELIDQAVANGYQEREASATARRERVDLNQHAGTTTLECWLSREAPR